ncbi:MAG: enoyl-CoA hydratase-related protein [Bacteroidota bacterium]
MKKIKVTYSHGNTIVKLSLADGKGNILDHMMIEDLQTALNEFRDQPQLKLIILAGEGKNFSFGASVEEHKKEYAAAMLNGFHALFYTMKDIAIPTLATISGQCLGGGMELALMCNILFADKTARLGQPEIVLGVFPPPASVILPEKIGLARAEELLLTGRILSADEARSIGLLNEVFDDSAMMETRTEKWIQEYILPKSSSSLRFAVRAGRAKFNHVLSNFLPQLESLYLRHLMETHDANEGIHAFLEKRKPSWENDKILSK